MKKVIFVLMVLGGLVPGISQTGFWEELPKVPGGFVAPVFQTKSGWLFTSLSGGDSLGNFISRDTAKTWTPFSVYPNQLQSFSIGQSGRLYQPTSPSNSFDFLKSIDGGQIWTVIDLPTSFFSITDDGNGRMFGVRKFSPTKWSVHESVDNGITWDSLSQGTYPSLRQISCDLNGNLFLTGLGSGPIFISFNGGYSWKIAQSALTDNYWIVTFNKTILSMPGEGFNSIGYVHREPANPPVDSIIQIDSLQEPYVSGSLIQLLDSSIIANIGRNFYKSIDDGLSWVKLHQIVDFGNFVSKSALADSSLLFSNRESLISISPDLAVFSPAQNGFYNGRVNKIVPVSDSLVYAVTNSFLLKKTNLDMDWQVVNFAENHIFQDFIQTSPNRFFITSRDSIFLFNDSLGTFSMAANPVVFNPNSFHFPALNPITGVVYLAATYGTYISSDGGSTWEKFNDSLKIFSIKHHPSGVLFALAGYGIDQYGLATSYDLGQTWQFINSPFAYYLGITLTGVVLTNDKISFDTGQSFETYQGNNFYDLVMNSSGHLFGTPYVKPILASLDDGISWYNLPYPNNDSMYTTSLAISNGQRLYISTSSPGQVNKVFRTQKPTTFGTTLTGQINKDADANCTTPDPADPLKNWLVQAQNATDTWFANTDTAGKYRMFVDTGSYEISIRPPLAHLLWEACDDTLNINLPELLDTTEADFLVNALADCPYLGVDLAISAIAPCFPSYGSAAWCNYGTETADTAYLDLTLDPLLDLTSSSLPGESLGGGVWRFQLGSIESGECGNLWFEFIADCDSTVVGQAVCLDAHIHPDSLCVDVPGWSGALLKVTATCLNDTSVNFEIKNVGSAPSQPLEYIIVEDDVVLLQGQPEIYDILETKNELISMPEGHFLRLESEQEPGYPLASVASAFSINCGAPTLSPTVLWYNLDDGPLSVDHECAIAVASFDPNDKTGLPLGYGNAHFIEANTDLEYTIRFQNTGTAAAHFVVVRDTLSEKLDPMSIRPGAASHPFSWKMEGNGFVSFRFDDINLPDSNANEAASHGFVSFKISQKPDLPDGTLIENRASIYFDYNGAVQTNTTQHRIGHDFIEILETSGSETISPKVKIWPNPLAESALLTFDGLPKNESYRFILTDISGKNARELPFSGDKVFFRRENLPSGLYFFEIKNGVGAGVFSGKLVVE